MSIRGTAEQIRDVAARILWFWQALNMPLSWEKGTLQEEAVWIGAQIQIDNVENSVRLKVPPEKVAEWSELEKTLHVQPLVPVKRLPKFIGKMGWASGFVTQVKPFVRMLHSAKAVESAATQKEMVYYKQIQPALRWLRTFLDGAANGLDWRVRAHHRHCCAMDVQLDASPQGGGAVLYRDGRPIELLALTWTKEEEAKLQAKIGDPASQATWECYIVLRALWCWLTDRDQGFVRIRGDAEGVLAALLKRSSKSPLLNKVVVQITLTLARQFRALEALHVWSEQNVWADALSRLHDPNDPACIPLELRNLPLKTSTPEYWRMAP